MIEVSGQAYEAAPQQRHWLFLVNLISLGLHACDRECEPHLLVLCGQWHRQVQTFMGSVHRDGMRAGGQVTWGTCYYEAASDGAMIGGAEEAAVLLTGYCPVTEA